MILRKVKIERVSIGVLMLFFLSCNFQQKESSKAIDGEIGLSDKNAAVVGQLDSLVQTLVQTKKTPGVVYGIQIGETKPHFRSFGFSDIENGRKTVVQDEFRIASITKTLVAVSIFQLVESKKIGLKDTLDKFFPNFPKGDEITIYQLLSHTSGIINWYEGKMPKDTPLDFPMCRQPHTFIERMEGMFRFEPGELFNYSNTGYVLLGEIIEIISGKLLEQYLNDEIFNPLGIDNTEMETQYNYSEQWAKGYSCDISLENPFKIAEDYPMPYSAGGLRSTTKDLLLFIKGIYDGKLISEEQVDVMTGYAKVNNGDDVEDKVNFYFPEDFVFPERPDYLKKYGHAPGFQRMEIYNSTAVWHGGGIAGFQSVLIHILENKTTLAILTNSEMPGGYASIWEEVQRLIATIE